ncbi:Signal transducer regulating beta-lactamase production, contains metallopeptidase domain [Verrucomicrobium sp. GAS474]|uniref:M56 family metallopeptidase n=1 Tax=Verrucomicrobium sp. GAS474 TaxID=1882831 RepID=UPI0008792378|nr:M56 family metallopeptidase [Verrucomicrobium sp. GAS474]SDT90327.1 Signal transducer regulating beta-lactamase production, contains metallopeptidase domain [Verrucomicrobium sp. GAS474]
MNPLLLSLLQNPAVEIALGSTLILGIALFFVATGVKASAAERHRTLLCALAVLVLLPPVVLWAPKKTIPVKVAVAAVPALSHSVSPAAPPSGSSVASTASAPAFRPASQKISPVRPSGTALLFAVWGGGVLFCLARLGRGMASLRRIGRAARPFALHPAYDGLPVLLSDAVPVPLLAGAFPAVILLPAAAPSWTAERLAIVLAHEAGHHRRGDHLVQPLLGLLQAFYWWQPLLWIASLRLRRERERACDDAVLSAHSFLPSDYAAVLIATVRQTTTAAAPLPAVAMASSGPIEGRLRAILAPNLRRTPAGWIVTLGALYGFFSLGFFVATARLSAQPPPTAPPPQASEAARPGPSISIESEVIEMDEATYDAHREACAAAVRQGDPANLVSIKGVNVLSAPTLRAKTGTKMEIAVTRRIYYPTYMNPAEEKAWDAKGKAIAVVPPTPRDFDHKEIGVTIDLTPLLNGNEIVLQGMFHLCNFIGFTQSQAARPPYFEKGPLMASFVETSDAFYETVRDGGRIAILLPGANTAGQPIWTGAEKKDDGASSGSSIAVSAKYVRYLFLSARLEKTALSANP